MKTNTGTITNDYWYVNDNGYTTTIDTSGATSLSVADSTAIASYAGFDPAIWGPSVSGYPILKQLPVYVTTTSSTQYGSTATAILSSLTATGLQEGDTAATALGMSVPGYLDVGLFNARSVLTSSAYGNLQGGVTITPKSLTIASTGVVADKTYDGTTTATLSGAPDGGLVGLVGDQTLTITSPSASFADKNAGTAKDATVTYTLTDGSNGGKTSNYTLVSDQTTANIAQLPIGATFSAASKTYDGNSAAAVTDSLVGTIAGDTVSLTYASAQFSDQNAGLGKVVTLAWLGLTGSDSNNYVLQTTQLRTTANIAQRALDMYGVKNSGGSATFSASGIYVKNAVPGDVIPLSGSVTLASANTGVQPMMVGMGGLTVGNPNYTLSGATGAVVIGNVSLALDKVASGTATINTVGNTTTITTSDRAVIDWLRFTIVANEAVNFVQPSAASIVLNRVTGNERTVIDGALNANGRVFIINSNGVLFSAGSSVNVGSLVASALQLSDSNFNNNNYVFTAGNVNGPVSAAGDIFIVDGGFVALASGGGVSSSGSLTAHGGQALLVAADKLTLTLNPADNTLTSYAIQTLDGTTSVGGHLNVASAGGNGGLVETAGSTVTLADGFALNTGTNGTWSWTQNGPITIGAGGNFSPDFVETNLGLRNLSLNTRGGDVNVNDGVTWSADTTLTLSASNNININAPITATGTNAGLTLNYGDYANTGSVAPGTGYSINTPSGAAAPTSVTLGGANAGLGINGQAYTLIHSMAQLAGISTPILDGSGQPVYDPDTGNPEVTVATGFYALGQNLDASGTTYSGPLVQELAGTLAGLGHTINNLAITDLAPPGSYSWQTGHGTDALIGTADSGSVIRDINLTNVNINATGYGIAGLVSDNEGTISNASVTGTIAGDQGIGGLAAGNGGTITNSSTNVVITGTGSDIGGLVGTNFGTIINSVANGSITVTALTGGDQGWLSNCGAIGGLVGMNYNTIIGSQANVNVTTTNATQGVGGLVGENWGSGSLNWEGLPEGHGIITNCTATGTVTAIDTNWYANLSGVGGLVGENSGGVISGSSASGAVTASTANGALGTSISGVGGLVGDNEANGGFDGSGSITNSTATGSVTGIGSATNAVGGLAGINYGGSITNSTASGQVSGYGTGGLVAADSGGTYSGDSWNITTTGQTNGFGFGTANLPGVTGIVNAPPAPPVVPPSAPPEVSSTDTDQQTAAQQATAQQAATEAAFAASAGSQAGQTAGGALQHDPNPSRGAGTGTTLAGQQQGPSLDSHIVFADSNSYSANIKSITVDGVQFELEDNAHDGKK